MIELSTPRNLPVHVPETEDEDPSPRFSVSDFSGAREYYISHGYVIVRSLFDTESCEAVKRLWESEVKPSTSFVYRQATAKAERHVKNHHGWVMNPVLNLQSVCPKTFPQFRKFAINGILTNVNLASAMRALLGDSPKVVQSMYFEGNSATWEHQDTYYLDSHNVGSMVGAWIALEDIAPESGRFFVCDKSHLMDMGPHSEDNNIADHHEEYIQSVVTLVREKGLKIRAPYLHRGDVLFWNSKTIHGSLSSTDPDSSRSSITVHAIPDRDQFMQMQNRIKPLKLSSANGVSVHHPKDLAQPLNKIVMWIESNFPGAFYALKRAAIRTMISRRSNMTRTSHIS